MVFGSSQFFSVALPSLRLLAVEAKDLTIPALIGALILIGVLLVVFFVFASYFGIWIQSWLTGAGVGIGDLIGMTFRKVNARSIVRSKIMAVQAGLDDPAMTSEALEAHYLAGGNVQQVVRAVIAAKKAKTISLTFREAAAIDLAGREVQRRLSRAAKRQEPGQAPPPTSAFAAAPGYDSSEV